MKFKLSTTINESFGMLVCSAVILLTAANSVEAQYRGDAFFEVPSIAVPTGSTGVLSAMFFTGTTPLGATQIDLLYSPQQVDVLSISPAIEEFQKTFSATQYSDGISFAALNSVRLNAPIGAVKICQIVVRPKVAVGSRIRLTLRTRSALDTSAQAFTRVGGYTGEVVVSAPTQAATTLDRIQAVSSNPNNPQHWFELNARAIELRPPGSLVTLQVLDENNIPQSQQVLVPPVETTTHD